MNKVIPPGAGPGINKMFSAIETMIEESVAQISERDFVQIYLPILADTSGEADVSRWFQVCGNARRPVDVMHGRTVLFRVPPLQREVNLVEKSFGQMSFSEMVSISRLKSDVMPSIGDVFIDANTVDREMVGSISLEDIATWNMILDRYGYEPITKSVVADKTVDASSSFITDEYSEI